MVDVFTSVSFDVHSACGHVMCARIIARKNRCNAVAEREVHSEVSATMLACSGESVQTTDGFSPRQQHADADMDAKSW